MTYLKIGEWTPLVPPTDGARSDNKSKQRYNKSHDSIGYLSEEEAEAILKSPQAIKIKSKMVIIRGENKHGDLTIAQGRGWLRVRYYSRVGYVPSMLIAIGNNDVWLPIHDVIASS
tara:strand:+ start:504 stop:851 length:348 start_codon:yes stop_codon:yes gene_type:complete